MKVQMLEKLSEKRAISSPKPGDYFYKVYDFPTLLFFG